MLCTIMTIGLTITGCGNTATQVPDQTQESRQITIQDTEGYKAAALNVIHGSEPDETIFGETFVMQTDDINPNAEINNSYICNNSLYIQTGSSENSAYMYRFQLDNDNKIISYIKYTVEA